MNKVNAKLPGFDLTHLCSEGVLGKNKRICALKGASVNLPCPVNHPSTPKWYKEEGKSWVEVFGTGTGVKYKISNGTQPDLKVMDLQKVDKTSYCCTDTSVNCQDDLIELVVTGKLDASESF